MLGERVFNWLFRPSRPPHSPSSVDLSPGPSLEIRLREVENELRDLKLVRLEWTETLDKLQAWTNRQNARDAKRLKAGIERLSESHEDAPEPTIPAGPPLDPHALKNSLRARLRAQNGGNR